MLTTILTFLKKTYEEASVENPEMDWVTPYARALRIFYMQNHGALHDENSNVKTKRRSQMPKFENKFVHFDWSDSLRGKKVFYGDNLLTLENDALSKNTNLMGIVEGGHDKVTPFIVNDDYWKFVYYDPNYEVKVAYEQGKTIQISGDGEIWVDWEDDRDPDWDSAFQFRIKHEEDKDKKTSEWTDLNVGDLLYNESTNIKAMVVAIDYDSECFRYCLGGKGWVDSECMASWRKV